MIKLDNLHEAVMKEYSIGCLNCDTVSTVKAWQKAGNQCPKCGGTKGVREEKLERRTMTDDEIKNLIKTKGPNTAAGILLSMGIPENEVTDLINQNK